MEKRMFIVQRAYNENPGGEAMMRERVVALFDEQGLAENFISAQSSWDTRGVYTMDVMEVNSSHVRLLEIWRDQQA